jgi:hypothetical protein
MRIRMNSSVSLQTAYDSKKTPKNMANQVEFQY